MSTDYRVQAAQSSWWILPPAIKENGELDNDLLLSRVTKLFGATVATFPFTGAYALLAPSVFSNTLFFVPVVAFVIFSYTDEMVAEHAVANIKAEKEMSKETPPAAIQNSKCGSSTVKPRVSFAAAPSGERGYSKGALSELRVAQQ
ncbi:MAG: hypothetical protein JSS10_04730 [Verrucomicrobia bacterium]|nr:hypothetical protein [Verrucomicrobiota bacterium]